MKSRTFDESEKIHSRDISITTYPSGEDAVIVEGILLEKRLQDYYILTGETKRAGILHHMIIRMRIKGPEKMITDIEVEMPGIPRDGCADLINCLKPVEGMTLTSGFTQKVLAIAGGIKGCFHLVSLLLAMAPAATQGYYAYSSRRPMELKNVSPEVMLKAIPVNSCGMWKEDGPLVRDILKKLEEIIKENKENNRNQKNDL